MAEKKKVSWGEALEETGRRLRDSGVGRSASALADLLAPDAAEPMPSGPNVLPADAGAWDLDHPGERDRQTAYNRKIAGAIGQGIYEGYDLPRAALMGEKQVDDPATGHTALSAINWGADRAMNTAGSARATAAIAPHLAQDAAGAAGIFIGRKGGERLGRGPELKIAEELERQGFKNDHILQQTGWDRGERGEWRSEIDDSKSGFHPHALVDDTFGGKTTEGMSLFPDVYHHPEYLQAYPEAADMRVFADLPKHGGVGGKFIPEQPWAGSTDQVIPTRIEAKGGSGKELREIMLHEMNHGADYFEGLNGGSSPSAMRAQMQKLAREMTPQVRYDYNQLPEKAKQAMAFRRYRHDAGEVAANNTMNRADMSAEERRAVAPWQTYSDDIDPKMITQPHWSWDQANAPAPAMAKGPSKEADDLGKALEPIRAYHGSPHDFDKFSLDKIGTGEGAQAYGHGLYFAENEGVAKSYRDNLTRNIDINRTPFMRGGQRVGSTGNKELDDMLLSYDDRGGTIDDVIDTIRYFTNDPNKRNATRYQEMLPIAERAKAEGYTVGKDPGHMYEVQINADPDRFLDWDKPLSEQPHVWEALHTSGHPGIPKKPVTAEDLANLRTKYGEWGEMQAQGLEPLLTKPGADFAPQKPGDAEALKKAGIPGVRYLDGTSRAGGEGSRNYVVFSDEIINIVKKYGIAGLALLPPAVLAQHGIDPASVGASSPQADALER